MNVPHRFEAYSKVAPKTFEYWHTEVEAAIMICPKPPPDTLRNHFKTWRIEPKDTLLTVVVEDQFMLDNLVLDRIDFLSNPTRKDSFEIVDGVEHLTWYRAHGADTFLEVEYTNQFGADTVRIDSVKYLLLPTAKEQPDPFPEELDHYKAYRIRDPVEFDRTVELEDQFDILNGVTESIVTVKPIYFLTPALKNYEEPMFDSITHYVAYEIFPQHFYGLLQVQTFDQFGEHFLQVDTSKFLLVPTRKLRAEPPPNDPPVIGQPDFLEGYVDDVVSYDITGSDPNGDVILDDASIDIQPGCGSWNIVRISGHGTSSGTWEITWDTEGCTPCDTHMVIHDLTDEYGDIGYCTTWVHLSEEPWLNHKMHHPQLPDLEGWDVFALDPKTLADDWQCSETGWVTDIHFWGSWKDLDSDPYTDDYYTPMPWFRLSIHRNIPASADTPWSRPGEQIWSWEGEIPGTPFEPPAMEHWFNPNTNEVLYNDHVPYWRYDFFFDLADPSPEPFYQYKDSVYWLDVSAIGIPAPYQWGWKSSRDHFMDDAVYTDTPPDGPWYPLFEPPRANWFDVYFNSAGEPVDTGSTNYYGAGWYAYEYWWNMWFYNNPFVTNPKHIWLDFYVEEVGPTAYVEFAINWSTDLWATEGVPGRPPLPGDDETLYIGRQIFEVFPGSNTIDFWITDYNPEWVSIDFVGVDVIINGWIWHECVQTSMDLAFVITGEEIPPDTLQNHFKTWRMQAEPFSAIVFVEDQFMFDTLTLERIEFFSNPAKKDTFEIVDDLEHLTWYRAHGRNISLEVEYTNQFGTDTVRIDSVKYLLLPTAKESDVIPESLDHYKAYRIKDPVAFGRELVLEDQFDVMYGAPEYIDSLKAIYFLTPALKNYEEPMHDSVTHYVAYEIFPKRLFTLLVNTFDQFGSYDLYTQQAEILLVPTEKLGVTVPESLYWKPPYEDYAPHGMPDIDQKQDNWMKVGTGSYTFCGPVAVANCFKWFDSKYNVPPGSPGDGMDQFPLVRDYMDNLAPFIPPARDDHDPWNVDHAGTPWGPPANPPPATAQPFVPGAQPQPSTMPAWGELVERLAWYFNTDGIQTGYCLFSGTNVYDMQDGIEEWFLSEQFEDGSTIADSLYEYTIPMPTFAEVETLVEVCEDVILLLGFWYEDPPGSGVWWRCGGHYVTVAGVNSEEFLIAVADPYFDNAEAGGRGRVGDGTLIPHPHGNHDGTVHNDEGNVSHDIYSVSTDPVSPGGEWELVDYPVSLNPGYCYDFSEQNIPPEFETVTQPWTGTSPIFTEIEYAVVISPRNHPPEIIQPDSLEGFIDDTVTYTFDGIDPNGDVILDAASLQIVPSCGTYSVTRIAGHGTSSGTWRVTWYTDGCTACITYRVIVDLTDEHGATSYCTTYVHLSSPRECDDNDPKECDTLYVECGNMLVPPGGGLVKVDMSIAYDETLKAIQVPLSYEGSPECCDSMPEDENTVAQVFAGSIIPGSWIKVVDIDHLNKKVIVAGVAMFPPTDCLVPGRGHLGTLTLLGDSCCTIQLDTTDYAGNHVGFMDCNDPTNTLFYPVCRIDTCHIDRNYPPEIGQPDFLEGYVDSIVEYEITGSDPDGDVILDDASIDIQPGCGSYNIVRTSGHGTSSGTWQITWDTDGCTPCDTHMVIHDLTDANGFTSYCTTWVHLSSPKECDHNDPHECDTLYVECGNMLVPPGGGLVTVDMSIAYDETLSAFQVPLSYEGSPECCDSMPDNENTVAQVFAGSIIPGSWIKVVNIDHQAKEVVVAGVAMFPPTDCLMPGRGHLGTLTLLGDSCCTIQLDTTDYAGNHVGFVDCNDPSMTLFYPVCRIDTCHIDRNYPPEIGQPDFLEGYVDDVVTYTITGNDPDGDVIQDTASIDIQPACGSAYYITRISGHGTSYGTWEIRWFTDGCAPCDTHMVIHDLTDANGFTSYCTTWVHLSESWPDHKMHYPQLPDPEGWDVVASEPIVLADDFMCMKSGRITDIHLWGSWWMDIENPIDGFVLSIHENIPGPPYSRPGELLWEAFIPDYEVTPEDPGMQGWYDPALPFWEHPDHMMYYRYDITNIPAPFCQDSGTIYWLNVMAIGPMVYPDPPLWGWKTSRLHYEDDAVWAFYNPPIYDWLPLTDPITGETLDLSFVITGEDAPCGDVNHSGAVEAGDVVFLISYLFRNGPAPCPLLQGDVNCNGSVDAGDVVYLISYLFRSGTDPCDPDGDGIPDC